MVPQNNTKISSTQELKDISLCLHHLQATQVRGKACNPEDLRQYDRLLHHMEYLLSK